MAIVKKTVVSLFKKLQTKYYNDQNLTRKKEEAE